VQNKKFGIVLVARVVYLAPHDAFSSPPPTMPREPNRTVPPLSLFYFIRMKKRPKVAEKKKPVFFLNFFCRPTTGGYLVVFAKVVEMPKMTSSRIMLQLSCISQQAIVEINSSSSQSTLARRDLVKEEIRTTTWPHSMRFY
jgi:hypothetical protein